MSGLPIFTTKTEEENFKLKQRIEQLEQEKLESVEAWNSQLEKAIAKIEGLEDEILELQAFMRELGFTIDDVKQSLAQHDREVAVNAIKQMIDKVCRYKTNIGKCIVEIDDIDGYIEQLKEGE